MRGLNGGGNGPCSDGQQLTTRDAPPRRYYVKDHLGSVRTVVDATGDVKEARDYYPFGLRMPGRSMTAGTPAREDFTGHERDPETGLHYAGARYYMSAFGRWMATDPILGDKSPTALLEQDERLLTTTAYGYSFNNPVLLADPDGRMACSDPPCHGLALAQDLWDQVMRETGLNAFFGGSPENAKAVAARRQQKAAEAVETAAKEGPEKLDTVAQGSAAGAAAFGMATLVTPDGVTDVVTAPTAAVLGGVSLGAEVGAVALAGVDVAFFGGDKQELVIRAGALIAGYGTGQLLLRNAKPVIQTLKRRGLLTGSEKVAAETVIIVGGSQAGSNAANAPFELENR